MEIPAAPLWVCGGECALLRHVRHREEGRQPDTQMDRQEFSGLPAYSFDKYYPYCMVVIVYCMKSRQGMARRAR